MNHNIDKKKKTAALHLTGLEYTWILDALHDAGERIVLDKLLDQVDPDSDDFSLLLDYKVCITAEDAGAIITYLQHVETPSKVVDIITQLCTVLHKLAELEEENS